MSKLQTSTDGDKKSSKRREIVEIDEDEKGRNEAQERIETIVEMSYPTADELQEVVTLCEKYPSLSTHQVCGYITPLSFLINEDADLETIEKFCLSFPKAPAIKGKMFHEDDMYPLTEACCNPTSPAGVIPFLVEVFPEALEWGKEADLVQGIFNYDVFGLFNTMETPGRLEDIKALLEAKCSRPYLRTAEVQQFILNLVLDSHNYKEQDVLLYIISLCPLATECNFRSIFPVEFSDGQVPVPMTLMMASLLPQLVKLELNIYWSIDDKVLWTYFTNILGATSRLEYLDLNFWEKPSQHAHLPDPDSLFVSEWIWTLLFGAISTVPRLQKLCLRRNKRFEKGTEDITNALVTLLGRNTLKTLHLEGFHPSPADILGALKTNKSLRYINVWSPGGKLESQLLDVLKEHNTTLATVNTESVFNWDDEEDEDEEFCGLATFPRSVFGEKMEFLCLLNCSGRAKARDPTTSVAELLGLVDTAAEVIIGEKRIVSCVYGLLRECPTIWAV